MRIEHNKNPHVAKGAQVRKTKMTMDDSAGSIRMMIDLVTHQYENHALAFIREASQNAYDSHLVAGNTETPFDMKFPTEEEPTMYLRDYGTGISHADMIDGYLKVTRSTKRKSDVETGGFGIGRLTYLIFTSTAAITSYQDGVAYFYSIGDDEDGDVSLYEMGTSETKEPNGFKVEFPIGVDKRNAMIRSAQYYLSRVDRVMPNFIGADIEVEKVAYSRKEDLWAIREDQSDDTIFAIMGGVAYPINPLTLIDNPDFHEVKDCLEGSIDLFFDIKDLTPNPSRESLNMNDKTTSALLERLTLVRKGIIDEFEKSIKAAKFEYQAKKAYHDNISVMPHKLKVMFEREKMKFNGDGDLLSNYLINIKSCQTNTTFFNQPKSNYGPPVKNVVSSNDMSFHTSGYSRGKYKPAIKGEHKININYSEFEDRVYIIADEKRGAFAKCAYHYENDKRVVIINLNRDNLADKAIAHLKTYGVKDSQIVLSSLLSKKPREQATGEMRARENIRKIVSNTADGWKTSKSDWSDCSLDDLVASEESGKTIYYMTTNNSLIDDQTAYSEYRTLKNMGVIDLGNIYFVNKTSAKYVEDSWINLSDYMSEFNFDKEERAKWFRHALIHKKRYNMIDDAIEDFDEERYRSTYRGGKSYYKTKPYSCGHMLDSGLPLTRDGVDYLRFLRNKSKSLLDNGLSNLLNSVDEEDVCEFFGFDEEEIESIAEPKNKYYKAFKDFSNSPLNQYNYLNNPEKFKRMVNYITTGELND